MKKINVRILIIAIIAFIIFPIQFVYGAEATLKVSSDVKVGETINVTVIMPTGAVGYSGTVTITYSDGSTDSVQIAEANTNLGQIGNENLSFNAKVSGKATIKVTNLRIVDSTGSTMNNPDNAVSATVQIQSNEPDEPDNTPTETPDEPEEPEPTFTDVDETVYATSRVNVRESYSTNSTSYGLIEKGTELKRTGIGSNGWSRVEYDGKTAYISTSYLSTEEPEEEEPTFTEVNEKMYVKSKVNVRESYSTNSNSLGMLEEGTEVTRIGVGSNGWSKVKYNDKIAYINSSFLVKDNPKETPDPSTSPTPSATPLSEEELKEKEKKKYDSIVKQIGVLPEVGNNIAQYIYIVVVFITIAGVIIINVKNKE